MVYFYSFLYVLPGPYLNLLISDVFLIRQLLHSVNTEIWIDVFRGSINSGLETGLL